jgi:hypothetical protein
MPDIERRRRAQHGRAAAGHAGPVHAALEPSHLVKGDAVFLMQDAANPDRGGVLVTLHADALPFEVLWFANSRIAVQGDEAVPERP